VGLAAPGQSIVAHDLRSEPPGIRNPHHVKHKGTSPERHLLPCTRLVYPNAPLLTSCANPLSLLLSLVPPHLPLVPTAALSTPALASLHPLPPVPASLPSSLDDLARMPLYHAFFGSAPCVCALTLVVALIPTCSQSAKGRLSVHQWLLFIGLSTIVYPSYNGCTPSSLNREFFA